MSTSTFLEQESHNPAQEFEEEKFQEDTIHFTVPSIQSTINREIKKKQSFFDKTRIVLKNKKLALRMFPRQSETLERLNNNVLLHKICKENCSSDFKLFTIENRDDYFHNINQNIIGNVPIVYLEFGVYKGNSISTWSRLNSNSQSRFYGFDSFEGLPENWTEKHGTGYFNLDGKIPKINDKRVTLVKGLFQNVLKQFLHDFEIRAQLVIHIDSDLYSSALYCLTQIDSLLVPGSIIMFDEFGNLNHEFRAFYAYTRSFYRKYSIKCATENWHQVAIELK